MDRVWDRTGKVTSGIQCFPVLSRSGYGYSTRRLARSKAGLQNDIYGYSTRRLALSKAGLHNDIYGYSTRRLAQIKSLTPKKKVSYGRCNEHHMQVSPN